MATPKKTAQGTWRIQIEVGGVRDSITLPTKREVQDWAATRTLELKAAAQGDLGKGKTLRDALRRYAEEVSPTRRGERWEVIRLAAFEGPAHGLPVMSPIALISDDDIRAWRDKRLKLTKPGTLLRDMTLLSAVFEHARTEWKWVRVNPIRDVKKPPQPRHRERVIKGWEIRRMLRALGYVPGGPVRTVSQSVAVAFLLALATGMRVKELCNLRWADVREAYGTAHNVKARMEGVSRDVPFSAVARRLVARMDGWDAATVFGVSPGTLDALFRRARKKAGLEGFTFHDSRHTAATMIAPRLAILDLCKMFGWKDPKQAMIYYNPTAAQIAGRL